MGKNDANQIWSGLVAKLNRSSLAENLDQTGSEENSRTKSGGWVQPREQKRATPTAIGRTIGAAVDWDRHLG